MADRQRIVHHRVAEAMFGCQCPGTFIGVWVANYNPPRNPCYVLLERAACLIATEISQLSNAEVERLPGGTTPTQIGIALHPETDVAAVQWRGFRTLRGRAFPLLNPQCSERPGLAVLTTVTPKGSMWSSVVCSDLAAGEAHARGIPYREELVRYTIHSLLHLAGEGDSDRQSAERMLHRQEALIRTVIGRSPHRAGRMDF
jgi:hypothetical protein